MISKNLIRIIGLLTILGSVLYILYRGFVILLSGTEISLNISWVNSGIASLQLIAIVVLLISMAGLYFLLSSALQNWGLAGLFLLFLGYLLIAGDAYAILTGIHGIEGLNNLGEPPSIPMIVAYGSASIGYIIIGLLLRKHKLFKPAITISVAVGSFVFFGSNFAKESPLMVEIIGLAFLFLMGLIPLGWQVYKMYQKD